MTAGENVMAPTNHKATPFQKNEVWQELTDLSDEKTRTCNIFNRWKENLWNDFESYLVIKEIKAKNGVDGIVQILNKLQLKVKNEFERLLNKTKQYGSVMSPVILAYVVC